MKVAVIGSRGYPIVYSGYETFVRELAERLVRQGVDVTVYCHRGLFRERPAMVNGVRLVYLPTIEKKNLSQFLHSLQSFIHACLSRYDAVLAVNAANGPFGLLTRLCRLPSAINVDGLEWLRPKWRGLGARYFRWASRQATRFFDRVITDSREMQRIYRREFAAESAMIAYGADVPPAADPRLLESWGLASRGYYLLVGRMVPDNNADLIVREFVASPTARKLVVVGGDPYGGRYGRALRSRTDPRLVFPGFVTDAAELAALYQHCFAYLHGHEFGGTNPSLLQALAAGCAVCALDTVFSREVLADGRHGLFFSKETGNLMALIAGLESREESLEAFRGRARQRVREAYSWEDIAGQYRRLFEELTAEKHARQKQG